MKEALKLALEMVQTKMYAHAEMYLKEALAQPAQQEPVAWMDIDEKGSASGLRYWSEPDNRHEVALYTTPPQRTWVGLDEKDFSAINQSCLTKLQAATSAESILKEKNT